MTAMSVPNTHQMALAVMSSESASTEQVAEVAVNDEKSQLAASNEKFSDATVDISNVVLNVSGSTATVAYQQLTTLTLEQATGMEPPVMADSVKRTATFKLQGASWKLSAVQHVTGSDASLIDALPTKAYTEAAEAAEARLSPVHNDISGQSPASTSGGPGPITAQQLKGLGIKGVTTTNYRPMWSSYNYTAMVNYATSHWNKGDSRFPIFGEDCVNFVSRALYNGGWSFDKTWFSGFRNYPHVSGPVPYYGHAFTVSADWFVYANGTSHRTHTTNNVWNLGYADVLQADWNRDGHIDHSMFITAISSNDKFITEHTNNALNKSMKLILAQNPNTIWYASVT